MPLVPPSKWSWKRKVAGVDEATLEAAFLGFLIELDEAALVPRYLLGGSSATIQASIARW